MVQPADRRIVTDARFKSLATANDLITRDEPSLPARTFADARRQSTNQDIPAALFTKINANTVVSDVGGRYDAAASTYSVPATGIYLCTGLLRVTDDHTSVKNLGLGIHTNEVDGPWFAWSVTRSESLGPLRQTFSYQRTAQFTANDLLRFYAWTGSTTPTDSAQFTVCRIG